MMVELHVDDFELIKKFYTYLGFEVIWERPADGFKGYLVMKWEGNILCFWGGCRDVGNHPYFKTFPPQTVLGKGVEIVLETKNLDAVYERIKDEHYVVEKLEKKPWGLDDFRIKDPYGYYIRITTPHNILSPEWAVP